jgi:hypothetical protein
LGAIDSAHAAFADFFENLEAAETLVAAELVE